MDTFFFQTINFTPTCHKEVIKKAKQNKNYNITSSIEEWRDNPIPTLTTYYENWLPFVVRRLKRSFLLISNSAFLSSWMVSSGCVTPRYSNNRIVGLKSLYSSNRLVTSSSTFSSHAKSFQFGISLIFLSRHKPNCAMSLGLCVRMVDNFEPVNTHDKRKQNKTSLLGNFKNLVSKKWHQI